jgi:hypothetical protein
MNRPATFSSAVGLPSPCAVTLRLGDHVICPTDPYCTARLELALAEPASAKLLADYAATAPQEIMGWLYSAARHKNYMLIKLAFETPEVLNHLVDAGSSWTQSRQNAMTIIRDLIRPQPKLWGALVEKEGFVQALVKWKVWDLAPVEARQRARELGFDPLR